MSYHVRRAEREITDSAALRAVVAQGRSCILGLARGDEPYLVTMSYGYDAAGDCLYFHCGKQGQKMDFIRANPRTCATIITDEGIDQASCDHSYRSVVIRGSVELIDDPEEAIKAVRLLVTQIDTVNPEAKLVRLKIGDKGFDALQILRLKIGSITGKAREAKP